MRVMKIPRGGDSTYSVKPSGIENPLGGGGFFLEL